MFSRSRGEASTDRLLEGFELLIILRVEALFFDKFPEPFNPIQIGRVRRMPSGSSSNQSASADGSMPDNSSGMTR